MASLLKTAMGNTNKSLICTAGIKDFINCLSEQDISGVAESWAGSEIYRTEERKNFVMENRRMAAFGRNLRHFAVRFGGEIKKKLLRTQHYEIHDVVSSETK